MRILLTGAGGNLGRAAIPALEAAGHELRLFDFRAVPTKHQFLEGDVRDPVAVAQAAEGVDAVIHGAALHGVHLDTWSSSDFWSTNASGTFNVYNAARSAGVQRLVLASSMVVYGHVGGGSHRWGVVTEESPIDPADVYGLTKVVAEDVARFHANVHQISTVALRLGMFVPETFERYGMRLLFGGVDDRDVGQAVALALTHEPVDRFAAFNIMADSGLTGDDVSDLDADVVTVLERRWFGVSELAREHGIDLVDSVWGRLLFPVDRAKRDLGYQPRYDFSAFVAAWRRGDPSHYPYADEPWWGVERPPQ
jgi:nucleoside-diphosphate-sugar epimerase